MPMSLHKSRALHAAANKVHVFAPRPQIFDWLDFMEKHYTHEGVLAGSYYDAHGYGTRWLKFAYVRWWLP